MRGRGASGSRYALPSPAFSGVRLSRGVIVAGGFRLTGSCGL